MVPLAPAPEIALIERLISGLFSGADELQALFSATQDRLPRLEQSILAKAFRGELVPQDPNDEPASGEVRTVLKNPRDYTPNLWRWVLLTCLGDDPVEPAEAVEASAY